MVVVEIMNIIVIGVLLGFNFVVLMNLCCGSFLVSVVCILLILVSYGLVISIILWWLMIGKFSLVSFGVIVVISLFILVGLLLVVWIMMIFGIGVGVCCWLVIIVEGIFE